MVFDPFGWLEKYVSARTLHRLIRAGIALVLVGFLIHRVLSMGRYWFKPLWVVETLVFVVFLLSYGIRKDPLDRSRGAREILIPLMGGILPFGLLFSPARVSLLGSTPCLYMIFVWMTAATCLTLWGLWTLRRSFSVTVEARELVTGGPYRLVRHPVYLGEMLTTAAVCVFRWSWINVFLLVVFIAIQLYRSYMEETKLSRVFPAYGDFAAKTLWFWPHKP